MTTALLDTPDEMLQNVVSLITANQEKGCTFATLVYRAKETQELAKHRLRLGVNILSMYEKDADLLANLAPSLLPGSLQAMACKELLDSLSDSLTLGLGNNPRYTLKGTFFSSPAFPGIKIKFPNATDDPRDVGLYITAVSDGKTVLEPGVYKSVKHRPLTVAKNELRKLLRTNLIRTFHLRSITRAAMFGQVMELDGASE